MTWKSDLRSMTCRAAPVAWVGSLPGAPLQALDATATAAASCPGYGRILGTVSIELRHLRYFIAVAEELNVTRAAERLHTVQPSLGRQIHALEGLLGAPLFHRDGHRLTLTDVGRSLLVEARRLMQEFDSVIQRVRTEAAVEGGRITAGFFPGAEWRVLPHLLPYLRTNSPEVQLILRTMIPAEQIAALRSRSIDVGFLRGPMARDPLITFETVLADEIIAVIPSGHPLEKRKKVSMQELAEVPMVRITRNETPAFISVLTSLEERAGIKFRTVLETEGILGVMAAVGAGYGFSLLPAYVEQIMPRTIVMRRLDTYPPPTTELLIAFRRDRKAALARFLSLVRACFKQEMPPVIKEKSSSRR